MSLSKETLMGCMTAAGEIYGKETSATQMRGYYRLLKDYSDEEIIHAFDQHALDSDRGGWFPRPADIVAQLEGTMAQAEDAAEAACLTPWDKDNLPPYDQDRRRKAARTDARVAYRKAKQERRHLAQNTAQRIANQTVEVAKIAPPKAQKQERDFTEEEIAANKARVQNILKGLG